MDQASDNAAATKPKEEKSLLEKLAEMEEKKSHDMKWTPLPPPNLELYLRKPVVLLDWDDNTGNSDDELTVDDQPKDEEHTTSAYDITDLDSIADDDSFANLSQLTARLEDELSILSSQDKDIELENQGEGVSEGGNDYIPPAPNFNKDDGDDDDDEYGSGSDMDLFGDEDYNHLYDNVNQQLQQGRADTREEEMRSFSALDFSLPALVKVGSRPSMLSSTPSKLHPHTHESRSDSQSRSSDNVKPVSQHQTSQQGSSEILCPREGRASKTNRTAIERTLETIHQFTDSDTLQHPAPRSRSSSSELKLSPDSDNLDPPPVNWGRGSRPMTVSTSSASSITPSTSSATATDTILFPMCTIKDEQPKAHCSEDILQPSTPLQSTYSVPEKCPVCNFAFPMG